jgi:hypothetical protein
VRTECPFCSSRGGEPDLIGLELADGVPGNLQIAVQVVGLDDAVGVLVAVPGDGADLRHGAAGERQSCHRGAAEIAETYAIDAATWWTGFPVSLTGGQSQASI